MPAYFSNLNTDKVLATTLISCFDELPGFFGNFDELLSTLHCRTP